jgi:hypothetical protein
MGSKEVGKGKEPGLSQWEEMDNKMDRKWLL